jgi:hypothetical protein
MNSWTSYVGSKQQSGTLTWNTNGTAAPSLSSPPLWFRHFITFTCYHRFPHLGDPATRDVFVRALERSRKLYRMLVYGFVVMPEQYTC